jgi:hypothetical protein
MTLTNGRAAAVVRYRPPKRFARELNVSAKNVGKVIQVAASEGGGLARKPGADQPGEQYGYQIDRSCIEPPRAIR